MGFFPGRNTGVDFHFLLQGIFLTQELNLGLLYCRGILYYLSYQGSPSLNHGAEICTRQTDPKTCPAVSMHAASQRRLILSQLLQTVEPSAVAVTVLPLGMGMGRNEPVVLTPLPVSRCERL